MFLHPCPLGKQGQQAYSYISMANVVYITYNLVLNIILVIEKLIGNGLQRTKDDILHEFTCVVMRMKVVTYNRVFIIKNCLMVVGCFSV